jgi:hypothetical protein
LSPELSFTLSSHLLSLSPPFTLLFLFSSTFLLPFQDLYLIQLIII